jgi:hypothetical protein
MFSEISINLMDSATAFLDAADGLTQYMGGQWLRDMGRAYERAAIYLNDGQTYRAAMYLTSCSASLARTNRQVTELFQATTEADNAICALASGAGLHEVVEITAKLATEAKVVADRERGNIITALTTRAA